MPDLWAEPRQAVARVDAGERAATGAPKLPMLGDAEAAGNGGDTGDRVRRVDNG